MYPFHKLLHTDYPLRRICFLFDLDLKNLRIQDSSVYIYQFKQILWRRGVKKYVCKLFLTKQPKFKCNLSLQIHVHTCCTFQNVVINLCLSGKNLSFWLQIHMHMHLYQLVLLMVIAESHLEWNIHLQCGSWWKVLKCLRVLQNTREAWQAE